MRRLLVIVAALALTVQWVVASRMPGAWPLPWSVLLPGLGIFGAAFLLSWAAELAQLEIPQALALAILALIAVLPEYAVDIYFAWTAGHDPSYIPYATANMTGSNRLLIGLGWPSALFAYWLGTRRREIVLEPAQGVEIATLLVATVYAFLIPLKRSLSLLDTVVFLALFAVYMVRASRAEHVEPTLEGPVEVFARWPVPWRRAAMVGMFALAGWTIYAAAQPFAEGLLTLGRSWGIEEFLLVQWLAPLASESPEFIVAILFAFRGAAGASLGTLVSSKVNQWTLLIGMLPLAYCVSARHAGVMPLDGRQVEEIFLTAAQSLFAVSVLANFRFEWWEAAALLALFGTQLLIPSPEARFAYAGLYVALTLLWVGARAERRRALSRLVAHLWRPS